MAIDVIVSNGQIRLQLIKKQLEQLEKSLSKKGILMLSILTLVLKEKLTSRQVVTS